MKLNLYDCVYPDHTYIQFNYYLCTTLQLNYRS
jgi:hypothetical protein